MAPTFTNIYDQVAIPFMNGEIKTPDKAHSSTVKLGNVTMSKTTQQPGWSWRSCIKPIVGTESCQAGHVGVVISGKIKCIHDDGSALEVEPGDAYYFAPGHDGWIIGDEPCEVYEFVETGKDFGPWKHAN